MDVRQTHVAAGMEVGQFGVVQPHQVENAGMKVGGFSADRSTRLPAASNATRKTSIVAGYHRLLAAPTLTSLTYVPGDDPPSRSGDRALRVATDL